MIKKIKLKQKTSTLFIVLEDNDPWGVLPAKILHFFSLKPGTETKVSGELLEKLETEIQKYAWNKLLNYLSYRERSIKEVRTYLQRLPLRYDITEALINKAIGYNYLNETRFCELYINDLQNSSKSRKAIIDKLMMKGVARDLIEESLEANFDKVKETEALQKLHTKAAIKYRDLAGRKKREKMLNFLTRKGFSYWQVKEMIDKE